jgi:hypothetical protein
MGSQNDLCNFSDEVSILWILCLSVDVINGSLLVTRDIRHSAPPFTMPP